jgi:uncharacterized membrane protein (DUF106 family)
MDKDLAKIVSGLCVAIAWAYITFYVIGGVNNLIDYAIKVIASGRLGGLGVIFLIFMVMGPFYIAVMLFGMLTKK